LYSTSSSLFSDAPCPPRDLHSFPTRRSSDLELLSQLWAQAREHNKAIPVLRRAARMSEDGDLYFRLGQSLLASEDYEKSENALRSEEHTSELQSRFDLVCRLLLEKKKIQTNN